MNVGRRALVAGAIATTMTGRRSARAGSTAIRLGVLNDMSGPYKDVSGPTAVACARQAVEDFDATNRGIAVEVVGADHQNKPDIGATIVRQWFDQGEVDAVVNVPHSGVALAVQQIARAKNKVFLCTAGGATSRLTSDQCSPNFIHWTGDSHMLARSTGGSLAAAGQDSWYLLVADYALGQQLERDLTEVVIKAGGRVIGRAAYPFPSTTDFSSFLLGASAAKPKVLALCNASTDAQNCIKQAVEFGIAKQMLIAPLLMFVQDVRGVGLELAQGIQLTESFYWDLNDSTRAWTQRVLPKTGGAHPNMDQAGSYAATLHYLKAVADMGVSEAKRNGVATVDRMKAMPFADDCFGTGTIRKDGQVLVTPYLFEVKKPLESTGEWDLYKLVTSTPPADAFRSLADGHCAFVGLN